MCGRAGSGPANPLGGLVDLYLDQIPVARAGSQEGLAEWSPKEQMTEGVQTVAEHLGRRKGIGGGHQSTGSDRHLVIAYGQPLPTAALAAG